MLATQGDLCVADASFLLPRASETQAVRRAGTDHRRTKASVLLSSLQSREGTWEFLFLANLSCDIKPGNEHSAYFIIHPLQSIFMAWKLLAAPFDAP